MNTLRRHLDKNLRYIVVYLPIAALLLATALSCSAQSVRVVTLDVVVENMVSYRVDVDPAQRGTNPNPTTGEPNPIRTFRDVVGIGDIVSVNGKPAKGIWTNQGTALNFSTTPAPGFAIANVTLAASHIECTWEFMTADGVFVGRLSDRGLGPHSVLGGGGAFLGAKGEHQNVKATALRAASVAEDPSRRLVNGLGGRWEVRFYLIPAFLPQIETTPLGPAIFHADDFSAVTVARPARPGELLIARANGLGPTRPAVLPAGTRRFSADPLEPVNSPINVTVSDRDAEVVNAIGWPGEFDVYRVDFRVPPETTPGTATVRLTAGWIPGDEVKFVVR